MSVDQSFIDVEAWGKVSSSSGDVLFPPRRDRSGAAEIFSPTEHVELAVRDAHVVEWVTKHERVVHRRCDLVLINDLQTDWSLVGRRHSRSKPHGRKLPYACSYNDTRSLFQRFPTNRITTVYQRVVYAQNTTGYDCLRSFTTVISSFFHDEIRSLYDY